MTKNKANGGYGITARLVQILKDDIVKVLHLIHLMHLMQIWNTQQWPQS